MKSALLFYRKLVADLCSIGFTINPYDPCVANKMIDGHQLTIPGMLMTSSLLTKIFNVLQIFLIGYRLDMTLLTNSSKLHVDIST
jgi:hypothetical protein